MAELVPQEAVLLLYRRHLKAALRLPNVTIRMLLLQQIRVGFRRHRNITSAAAQRDLIDAAQKDLAILEDERHSKTLYVGKHGVVSCMEHEMRRTQWHFHPRGERFIQIFGGLLAYIFISAVVFTEFVDDAFPDIAETVDMMAMKLEVDDPNELWDKREKQIKQHLELSARQQQLEQRILATFRDAPDGDMAVTTMPTLRNPMGTKRLAPEKVLPSVQGPAALPAE